MAKDPAVLFYTSDFLSGTYELTYVERGMYITMLCIQHQKENNEIPKDYFDSIIPIDSPLRNKFVITVTGYYNNRMRIESDKRKAFCQSRRDSVSKRYVRTTHVDTHVEHTNVRMENVNENANTNTIKDVKENTWREDFNIYKNLIISAFEELKKDNDELNKQQEFYPKANIVKSIEKGIHNFWGTKAGWKHKKKSRSKEIDCRSTLINSIKMNIVYSDDNEKPKEKNAYIEYMEKKKRGMTDEEIGIENSDG